MRRARFWLALAAAAGVVAGCGNVEQTGDERYAPRAGQWQISTGLTDMALPWLRPEAEADRRAEVGDARVERLCLPGGRPRIGEARIDPRCAYTEVNDRGPMVDRVASCTEPGRRVPLRQVITGTRSDDHYSLTVVTHETHPITGAARGYIETSEEGRWLGPCPDASQSSE